MANKRQLKKAICRTCGDVAGECIFAADAFGTEENYEKWDMIIIDVAMLQGEAVKKVSTAFDKQPKDFANAKEFNKAHRAFAKQTVKAISELMTSKLQEVAGKMNELMPKN